MYTYICTYIYLHTFIFDNDVCRRDTHDSSSQSLIFDKLATGTLKKKNDTQSFFFILSRPPYTKFDLILVCLIFVEFKGGRTIDPFCRIFLSFGKPVFEIKSSGIHIF